MSLCNRHQSQDLREKQKQQLAQKILDIIGVRYIRNKPYIINEDVHQHAEELLNLKPEVSLYLTSLERRVLYKTNLKEPAICMVRCVLKQAGYPMICTNYHPTQKRTITKYSLTTTMPLSLPSQEPIKVE
jgi:hypothetical protein